jgi:hypothetical protein
LSGDSSACCRQIDALVEEVGRFFGLNVGGPAVRLPDEYDDARA